MKKPYVILTGFMGTGKSTIGVILARQLHVDFIDLDAIIVQSSGRSIPEIFAADGEAGFRALESKALRSVLDGDVAIVSTGGGAVIDPENRRLMRESGIVVNITASPGVILARTRSCADRPLLRNRKSLAEIEAMLGEREQFYADADIRIDTDGKNVEDVAAEIVKFIEEKHRLAQN